MGHLLPNLLVVVESLQYIHMFLDAFSREQVGMLVTGDRDDSTVCPSGRDVGRPVPTEGLEEKLLLDRENLNELR